MKKRTEPVGLPPRPFLYTVDQLSVLIAVSANNIKLNYLHYEGLSVGGCPPRKMRARNISPDLDNPEWRVSEQELIRWMRGMGFRYHERAWFDH